MCDGFEERRWWCLSNRNYIFIERERERDFERFEYTYTDDT